MKVQELIDRAGGIRQLAKLLKVSPTSVYDWRRAGYIPRHRAVDIEREFDLGVLDMLDLLGLRDGGAP